MRAIIVDDERFALLRMEKLLKNTWSTFGVDVAGIFQDSCQALEMAGQEPLHLAFLDIEMPEINGFELADLLLQMQPHIHIVFVTAYHEYAVKAFEQNALDYLLKPVHPDRLYMTLRRVNDSMMRGTPELTDRGQLSICCFDHLHYRDHQGQIQHFPWKTQKAQELFGYLILQRDKAVSKQYLIDLLWPEYDTVRATTQLHTAVYQIRRVIKMAGLEMCLKLLFKDDSYCLIWRDIKLDVDEWERLVRNAAEINRETLDHHLSIMAMYKGNYLEAHAYTWAGYEQERIKLIWADHARRIARYFVEIGHHTEAILWYKKLVEQLPQVEEGTFELMKIYAGLNRKGEVKRQYHQLLHTLEQEYAIKPSKALTEWYEQWAGQN